MHGLASGARRRVPMCLLLPTAPAADGESDREVSPSALLSPRSAAALNGAKIKPDTAQQAQQQQDSALDSLMLDSEGCGTGAATPCDSDALGPVPPLLRPAPGGHLDSPFSAGGLLRSSPGPGGLPPPHVYAGKPLFSEGGARPGHGPGTGAAAAGGAAAHAAGGGGVAGLGMARSMSLTGGMLDGIALPPAADPIHSLLPVTGPARCAGCCCANAAAAAGMEALHGASWLRACPALAACNQPAGQLVPSTPSTPLNPS